MAAVVAGAMPDGDRHVDERAAGGAPEVDAARETRKRVGQDANGRQPPARRAADRNDGVVLVDAEPNSEQAHSVAAHAIGVAARVAIGARDSWHVSPGLRVGDAVEFRVAVRDRSGASRDDGPGRHRDENTRDQRCPEASPHAPPRGSIT